MKKLIKPHEMMTTTTIRIEANDGMGNLQTGTGFYYAIDDKKQYIPMIITNKHVVVGMAEINVVFTLADEDGNKTRNFYRHNIVDAQPQIIYHPDDTVDLCAITLFPIIYELKKSGYEIYTHFVTKGIIPSEDVLVELDAVEDILMIGYPNGLWDEKNNLPLVRSGITASHPAINHNNQSEFLIDAACFPGSSGSPVYYQDKSHKTDVGADRPAYKIYLLGILYSGPVAPFQLCNAGGELLDSYVSIPIGLGYVIKASQLMSIEHEILKIVS